MGFGTLAAFISYTTQLFRPHPAAGAHSGRDAVRAGQRRARHRPAGHPAGYCRQPRGGSRIRHRFCATRGNWPPIAGGVEFRDVTFAYKTGETVLRDFNLKVEPGQTIALVGETGAGKSTIVNLVCRFYEPTAGPGAHRRRGLPVSAASSGCTPRWAMCCRRRTCSAAPLRTTSATAARTPPWTR